MKKLQIINKKRIVILGDSLGMPTGIGELEYENTYPYLLQLILNDYEIISRNRRTNDTKKQLSKQNIFDDIEMLKPEYLVVHLGIVDCAPRVFTRTERAILKILPKILSSLIIKFISKYRYIITKTVQKVYTTKNVFEYNLEKFVEISKNSRMKLIFISILDTNDENKRKSYNFKKNIIEYNEIMEKVCKTNKIKLIKYSYPNNFLLNDGIHINKEGSKFIADELKKIISNYSV